MTEPVGPARTGGGDGAPQPVSEAMSKQTADFYVAYTGGQLQAFRHADGHWYLYAPRPAGATDEGVPPR